MTSTQRGFTLMELMVSVAVLAIFCSVVLGLHNQAEREQQTISSYQRDLLECRAALRSIERDVRAAHRVETVSGDVGLFTSDGRIGYRIVAGELHRTAGSREDRVLARCIADIDIEAHDALVRVSLELRARSTQTPRRAATFATCVAMRDWESRR